jgi:aminopeptidase N
MVALNLDGMQTTHPIEVEVRDEHQINEVFDTISYR